MLVGIGPKQARNLWQYLGLSRFEIPVDSRVSTWLRENGFPMPLLPDLLFNEKYYCLALDGVQSICRAAEVLPCIFDAAVFASYDSQWKPDLVY